jgi:Zn-dependent peptidase ImmA (M78 family)/DNA-binding XRE family transcriptional regulator
MSATAAWVARRLREARENRGWSQQDLASRLGRTQTAISYWESGKRTPDIDDLLELSDAFEEDFDFFLPPKKLREPIRMFLRATADQLASRDLRETLDHLVDEAEHAAWPSPEITIKARRPEDAAEELIEKGEVTEPPVPVADLAELCGLLVLHRQFPQELSGLVFEHEDGGVIGVNRDHHEHRRRFTIAHELGHHLLDHHERFHIDIQEGELLGHDWRAERAANVFAAELLMPRRFVVAAFESTHDPALQADRFNVSELAMGYRLVNLGLR